MRLGEIAVPATRIRGVGPATAKPLASLGILTVGDVLSWWPRDWEDRTVRLPLSAFEAHAKISALATVVGSEWFGFGRMKTLKLIVRDDEETVAELVCFNRPFLERQFPEGSRISVYGSFRRAYGSIQSSAFEIELADDSAGKVLPVYPLCAGISQAQMRKIASNAIDEYCRGIESELPESVRLAHKIPEKGDIVKMMHRPENLAEAQRAREALIFEELFLFEYAIGARSLARRGRLPAITEPEAANSARTADEPLTPLQMRLIERLPFKLTDDQISTLAEINGDIRGPHAMARLLQGDVGSGKTLVAFLAALAVVEAGGQVALLAPTELLARQHAENAARLLDPIGVRLAFLTGNVKAAGRARLIAELSSGGIDIVIGTHALFSSGVSYKKLALAIIDEQHRFGVLQRSAIQEKGIGDNPAGKPPHLLMMSATPIPRTLALSVFGDLDVSFIRTMPPGRKPVKTHLSRTGNEDKVYEYVRRELEAGHQAYFVYPIIGEEDESYREGFPSDGPSLKSATDMAERLATSVFPDHACALIHSRVEEGEQRKIMEGFRTGSIRVLVATSVVEVGVDVANATCMVIEHAERFGLSALHQLRGRVGRGDAQSYCFLVYSGNLTEEGKARLRVMHETTDGFALAEEDLRIRGPGEITGLRQSGYASFVIADPIRDRDALERARQAAFELLEQTR